MWWILCTGAAGTVLILLLFSRPRRLSGRLIVLADGDSSIGLILAQELARQGARVIIAGDDQSHASESVAVLLRETRGCVQYRHLDLKSQRSVREFASDLASNEKSLDVLINNCAVSQRDNAKTEDGIAVEVQMNYLGPFLLTVLLLPLLKAAPQGRVVTVSSVMHYLGNIHLHTLVDCARDKYTHKRVFANTMLCNILFTRELSRRLEGTKVTANCFHPGVVDQNVDKTLELSFYSTIVTYWRHYLNWFITERSRNEATTALYLTMSSKLKNVSGKYFVDCKETKPSKTAMDNNLAEQLWLVSERIVKLK